MIEIKRTTKETDIFLKLDINGNGKSEIDTGVGFFNHMLESFSKHSQIDLFVECKGDTHVDDHHTVEDIGIVLGQAINRAIYPIKEVERFSNTVIVMDEAAVSCAMDLSNRPFLVYEIDCDGKIGTFDVELAEEFFRALTFNAALSVHLVKERGKNRHHIIEAAFKAYAVALRRALAPNVKAGVPSTKGVL
ncbi:imidazoleglycerol-phosphate dehydratase HisB [Hydrogenimonas thermophila]|uniref:Imidazoleglycerol-phosphate dehydratase n=1 Tax=Hydrogenimonas thermophila TaxID=223786 RepID=A0A1I5NMG2_9BACT|nr:imidazoleglycerol-phosphate dehydratase HisB [Hydrogenimonas thermophila]WOE69281.1 imidazoleglycerol-phosphate dehydratase HisB [Hydrogenimonas thermophila]WOE71791.1 imidazoleglycerol-phosphate dehydratase HisB [Hydrogenimonas thermophila]SFP22993.1 imidazoleglycerol-phosphate dehydratase [Hydrogenimonas thermophila]